jgi:hypothetical protein
MPLSQPSARRGGLYRRGREMARARGRRPPRALARAERSRKIASVLAPSFPSLPPPGTSSRGLTRQSIDVDPRVKPAGDGEGNRSNQTGEAQLCAMTVPLSGSTITVWLWPFFVTVAEKLAPSCLKLLNEA